MIARSARFDDRHRLTMDPRQEANQRDETPEDMDASHNVEVQPRDPILITGRGNIQENSFHGIPQFLCVPDGTIPEGCAPVTFETIEVFLNTDLLSQIHFIR